MINLFEMKKRIYSIATLLLIFISCSPEHESLESLRKQRAQIKKDLIEVDQKIANLDTASVTNLPIVGLTEVIKGDFSHFIEVQGNVVADKNILLNPELSGVVEKIYIQEGQQVSEGQSLIKINTDIIDQQLAEMKQSLELAKYVRDKQAKLWEEEGIGSELEYKQANSNYKGLLESINTLQTQRAKAIVRAPFSGVVDQLVPNLGEMVAPSSPVVRLVNLNELKVVSDISESYVNVIKKESFVNVSFESQGVKVDSLQVSRTGLYINPNNRTFSVEVDLPSSLKVLPNLIAKLSIRNQFEKDVLLIPTTSIMQDNKGNNYVFTLSEENKVVKRIIQVGGSYNGMTLLTSGLSNQELIINVGNRGVRQGDLVSVK